LKLEKEEVNLLLELLGTAKLKSTLEIKKLDPTKREDGPHTNDLLQRDKIITSTLQRLKRSKITPPGASQMQKQILDETAQKKVVLSMKKIDEAIKHLKEQGKKITLVSVSQEADIAYNTAKKYKEYILEGKS